MRMPMMAMTTSSSTSVKPFSRQVFSFRSPGCVYRLAVNRRTMARYRRHSHPQRGGSGIAVDRRRKSAPCSGLSSACH